MSATKRGKQKQKAEVSEEEDFETFVRESLGQLSKGQEHIIPDISNLEAKVKLNETALDKISSQFKTLNDSFEELKGELHDARCKVDEMESSVQKHAKQIEGMRERLLSLERYSREYNLRFHNVPESTNEDCVQKVRDILSNQLDMEPEIENAHRVGLRNDDKPRVIICKFLYRPQRYKVIQKKRDLEDGIWVTEDLIWEDREAKKKLKEAMKEAFENVINNVPLRDHITPHYGNLGLIKLPDIVKLNTCQLIYDDFVDKKPSNFTLSSVSEQHNYDTRSASLQHLNPSIFRINLRKFCPTVIGCYYWNDIPLSIREKTTKKLFERALFNYYLAQY